MPEHTSRGETIIAAGLLGLALVLLLRRYAGINHDAALYLGQGLLLRWPDIFGSDLAFVHGAGQERYTIFPWLIGQALALARPATVFAAGAFLAILAFAAASWYCVRAIAPEGQRYWAWLGVMVLPAGYGMASMFGYGEQFLTPRPIAEAFCLVAVGLLAYRRLYAAFACLALAALFHPLQAIAAAQVLWVWLVFQDRRWLHALWGCLPIALLAAMDVQPFDELWQQLDPEWLANLRGATAQVFVTSWSSPDFHILLFDAAALAYAWRMLRGRLGTWCGAALLALTLGMAANLVLVDWLHLILPAKLQFWRVHWLAHWLAMAAVMLMLFRDIRARDIPRALLLVLAFLLVRSMASWSWPLLAALYAAWPAVLAGRARVGLLLGFLFGAGILVLFSMYLSVELAVFRAAHHRLDLYAFDRRMLIFPVIGLGLPLLAMHAWSRLPPAGRKIAIAFVLVPLLVVAGLRWDARSPVNLAMEQAAFRSDIFGVAIPEDAQVYWGQHMVTGPWLVLRRASYFSPHQIAGQVFNRGLSIDAHARIERMRPLIEQGMGCDLRTIPYEERLLCHVGDDAMERACTRGAGPAPDYLVLVHRQPQRSLGSWTITDPVTREPMVTYHLYRCTDVMADIGDAPHAPAN